MTTKNKKLTKRQIRIAWLNALESGKYRQGNGALSIKTSGKHREYCCLGVLCELAAKEGVVKKNVRKDVGSCTGYGEDDKTYYLPKEVKQWAGLKSDQGAYSNTTLAIQNDDGKSFKEIAKLIRKHASQLFVGGK